MKRRLALWCPAFAGLMCLGAAVAEAQEWPDFRGPDAQGHSTERGLPLEWNERKNINWKTAVPGLGWSSPVVANGKVWITTGASPAVLMHEAGR